MKRKLAFILLLFSLLPVKSKAEFSPELQKLMDQPLTVFDFGLIEMEREVSSLLNVRPEIGVSCSVEYSQYGQIIIDVSVFYIGETAFFNNKSYCRDVIQICIKAIVKAFDKSEFKGALSGFKPKKHATSNEKTVSVDEVLSMIRVEIGGIYDSGDGAKFIQCKCEIDGTNREWDE